MIFNSQGGDGYSHDFGFLFCFFTLTYSLFSESAAVGYLSFVDLLSIFVLQRDSLQGFSQDPWPIVASY